MTSYTAEHANNDLEVIDWLLRAGAITKEDATFMADYVRQCAREPLRGSQHVNNHSLKQVA